MERRWIWILLIAAALLLPFWLASRQQGQPGDGAAIPYTTFRTFVDEGRVDSVTMRGDEITVMLDAPVEVQPGTAVLTVTTRIPPVGDAGLLPALRERGVAVTALPSDGDGWFLSILPWLIFLAVYVFFWTRFSRGVAGGGWAAASAASTPF